MMKALVEEKERQKTLPQKEKMLATSIFPSSHNVRKSCPFRVAKAQGCFG